MNRPRLITLSSIMTQQLQKTLTQNLVLSVHKEGCPLPTNLNQFLYYTKSDVFFIFIYSNFNLHEINNTLHYTVTRMMKKTGGLQNKAIHDKDVQLY